MLQLSQQEFNAYVKELGRYCGLDTPVQVVHYQGSQRVEQWLPKHELLSSYTGRRTFVTHSLERGMAPAVIMKCTGAAFVGMRGCCRKMVIQHILTTDD